MKIDVCGNPVKKPQRYLELTFRLNEGEFELDVYEPESGLCTNLSGFYDPYEHPEFNDAIGNEIYSWVMLWKDMMKEEESENEN